MAALAIAGCGGGGDSSSSSSAAETPGSAEAEGGEGQEGSEGKEGKEQGEGSEGKEGEEEGKGGGEGSEGNAQGEGEGGNAPPERELTKANITLESPDVKSGASLKATYTCDGKNTWPNLKWKGTPPDAEELVLLVLSVRPVVNKLYFDWAVAGLDPSLAEIEEGKLPAGATVGENSFGKNDYSLCPDKGQKESFIFMLFAIPEALDPAPGFDARDFRSEVLAEHGSVGLLSASYARKQ